MNGKRCSWCGDNPLYIDYHDNEWGVPLHDDRALFEMLVLEGAQAGLSWLTILKKRNNYRTAFNQFEVNVVAHYGDHDIQRLLNDKGIVRNRLKIEAAIKNARAVIAIQEEFGQFDTYLWRFVDNAPLRNRWNHVSEIPVQTAESEALSKDLKRRGCSFVGPTICYAFMQAVGMVNDHTTDCFRYPSLNK